MSNTDATPTQYRHYTCRLCEWSSAAHPDPDGTGETPDLEDEYREAWSHVHRHRHTVGRFDISMSSSIGTVVTFGPL